MKFNYFFVGVVMMFVGAGCMQAKSISVQTTPVVPLVAAQEIVYKDVQLGFTVTMPAEWKNYTTKYREINWGIFKTNSVDIGLPGDDSLFNINVFTDAEWKQLQSEPNMAGEATLLAQKGGTVFVGASAQSAQPQNMERFKEIGGILKTLKAE